MKIAFLVSELNYFKLKYCYVGTTKHFDVLCDVMTKDGLSDVVFMRNGVICYIFCCF